MAKGRTVGIIIGWIGTALATALLAGGAVYLVQARQINQVRQDLDSAKRQITELQSGDDSIGRDDDGQDLLADDDRRLISYSDNEGYGVDNLLYCKPEDSGPNAFSLEDATTTVTYADELGFSIELPWNPDWGTSKCRINEYESTLISDGERVLLFGPLIEGEGGLGRLYALRAIPSRSADEAISSIPDEIGEEYLTQDPELDQLADFDVVTYAYTGLCDAINIEIIGLDQPGKSNFVLGSGCTAPPFDDDLDAYEDILEGFQLL